MSEPSQHFPPLVRELLAAAAQTPITPADPLARQKAIERAIERAKQLCPEKFKPEES